jgi:phosphoenolpyruvate synthase/pyruvate phosphate dikinase
VNLTPLVGAKAANLAEAARVLGGDQVPRWFAITDRAFQEALEEPLERNSGVSGGPRDPLTVRLAIERVLARHDQTAAWQEAEVEAIWRRARLPAPVVDEVARAYAELGAEAVAIRSSGLEEDTERETRAGQFRTFLFVKGEAQVLEYLLRAWAGLWTERAIIERTLHGLPACPHGGVIVQEMVLSRASGVIQTVNAAESRPRELVLNVGLGLGEGIVSGIVAADHVVIAKPEDAGGPLRFRYLTADKRERVVYAEKLGQGTVRVDTLAHQRLRPALEYPELLEVVETALRLEAAYAAPLDIEFGFDGPRLRVLQVRPVPSAFAVWRDTVERYPLRVRAAVEVRS